MRSVLGRFVAAAALASSSALRVIPSGPNFRAADCSSAAASSPNFALLQPQAQQSASLRAAFPPTMQQPTIDETSDAFYAEYVQTDPVTGEATALSLDEKEKLYLECLDAYYNEGGKQLLSNEEYEQLKLDLDFDGSKVATFSKDEIKFVLANKRFKMGKSIMDDAEYDALRLKLKEQGSSVVIHQGASCNVDTGLCKTDLTVDQGKTRLLYLPGTAGGLILACEVSYWTLHLDPILSIVLGALPAYFFGVWFTENVFAQRPLVTQGTCPDCQYLQNIYFGDLFAVATDGIVGEPSPPADEIAVKCPNCKADIVADRNKMVLTTTVSKIPA